MSLLSFQSQRALAITVAIARLGRSTFKPANELAAEFNVAKRHLEPDLQSLQRAGILKGRRGLKGGYSIARKPEEITCASVLQAIGAYNTPSFHPAVTHLIGVIETDFRRSLMTTTIAMLLNEQALIAEETS